MPPSTRILLDHIFGWVLWITYFAGIAGCWMWLVYVAMNREEKIEE